MSTVRSVRSNEGIDWEAIRSRLTRAAAESEQALSPERAKALMDERAATLARVPPRTPHAGEFLEVITFGLADERYAIETCHVREVIRFTDYTLVPGGPDFLVGVSNLRGEIVAVVDLRKLFGVTEMGLTDLSRAIILGQAHAEFGILADVTHEVTSLRRDELLEPPLSVAGIGRDYLRGVTRDALIVLDGAVLLRDSRLFIDQGE